MRFHLDLHLLLTCSLFFMLVPLSWAEDQSTEARLREALKGAVQQLRAAQDQLATAQAAQAESENQLAACKNQLTQANSDFKALKEKSEAEHEAAVQAIGQLKEQNGFLQRVVEDRERKNYELFKTGNEVLTRYEKFGLGEAIAAKEPFVGLTRVKLENQVQDYEDKFANNKTYAGQPVTAAPKVDGAKAPPDDRNSNSEKEGKSAEPAPVETQEPALPSHQAAGPVSSPSAVTPTPEPSTPLPNANAAKKNPTDMDKDKVMHKP